MSPVFITAIQFSKCAPLVGGNFIIAQFPNFVKRFFEFFSTVFSGVFISKCLPSYGRLSDYITSKQVCQVPFLIFFKLFLRGTCCSLATDAILTHPPLFVNTFFDELFYKTPQEIPAAFVHFYIWRVMTLFPLLLPYISLQPKSCSYQEAALYKNIPKAARGTSL